MKQPKTSQNDDFDFDSGDSFEFFPLDSSSGEKDNKPKGVKSYLKNVVKSIGRLGVKVSKDLYPEAYNLKDQFLDDDGASKTDIKSVINNFKKEAKKYNNVAADVVKSVKKDVNHAITTGEFSKSEDENMDMSDLFGDDFGGFDFGGDDLGSSSSGDLSSNESEESDSTGTKPKSHISTQEITAKSALASAKLNTKLTNKQISATMGIAQSQMKHENMLFSQQMMISQEQHRQKMSVMRNIANNLIKVVKQNNTSNRAQMEFSAKQLAFSQDMSALIKDIRNAQWSLIKPEKKKENEKSKFDKIINGGGFNLNFLTKQLMGSATSGVLGDILGLKDQIDGLLDMSDMMGGPGNALKGMVFDGLRQGLVNRMISGDTRNKIDDANLKIKGLPGAINRKFGEIYRNGGITRLYNQNIKNKLLKTKFGGKINDFLEEHGVLDTIEGKIGELQIGDNITSVSDKYKMGDPDKVHPFDNKAHKVLTEVIPSYLARIDAGVNHTEELYYDFDAKGGGKFKKVSSLKTEVENRKKEVVNSLDGVWDFRNNFNENIGSDLDNISEKDRETIIENILKSNRNLSELRDRLNSSKTNKELVSGLLGSRGDDDSITDEQKEKIAKYLVQTFGSMDKESAVNFQQSMDQYKTRMTDMYMKMQDDMNQRTTGGALAYNNLMGSSSVENDIKKKHKKLETLRKKLSNINISATEREKTKKLIQQTEDELHSLQTYNNGSISSVNSNLSSINYSDEKYTDNAGLNDYAIKDLEDDSTHGLVQNIYNLLLEGIDVYTHTATGERENIKTRQNSLSNRFKTSKIDQKNSQAMETGYEEFDLNNAVPPKEGEDESYEYSAIKNKMKIYIKDDINGGYIPIKPEEVPKNSKGKYETVYCKSSEYRSLNSKVDRARKAKYNASFIPKSFDNVAKKGPLKMLQKVFGKDNYLNKGISLATGAGADFLGEHFYGEEGVSQDTKELKDKFTNSKIAREIKKHELRQKLGHEDKVSTIANKASEIKDSILSKTGLDTLISGAGAFTSLEGLKEYENYIREKAIQAGQDGEAAVAKFRERNADKITQLEGKVSTMKNSKIAQTTVSVADKTKKQIKDKAETAALYGLEAKDKIKDKVETAALYGLEAKDKVVSNVKKWAKNLPKDLKGIKIGNKSASQILSDIGDKKLVQELKNAKTVSDKIKILRNHGSEAAQDLANKLVETKNKAQELGFKGSITAVGNSVKTKVQQAGEAMGPLISKLRVGGQSIGEKISNIADPKLNANLKAAKTIQDKIKVLRDYGSDETKQIASKLDEYVQKHPNLAKASSGVSSISSKIKDFGNNAIESIQDKLLGGKKSGSIDGDSAEEQKENAKERREEKEKEKDREIQEERNGILEKMLAFFSGIKKDGIPIDDASAAKIGEAAGEASDNDGGDSLLDDATDLLDGPGKKGKKAKKGLLAKLKKSKLGKKVLGKNSKIGKIASKVKKGKLGKIASKLKGGKIGKLVKGLKGGKGVARAASIGKNASMVKGLGKVVKGATAPMRAIAKGVGKVGVGTVKTAGKGVGKVAGLFKSLLGKLFSKGVFKGVSSAGKGSIINGLVSGLKQFGGKLTTKIASFLGTYGSVVGIAIPIASAVIAGTKAFADAPKYFKLGKGVNPPWTMRLACGLAAAIDGLLLGIPGLICKFAGKNSLPEWFYDLTASQESRAAIERYRIYNEKRAKIYGVGSPNALAEWERRNTADKMGRALLSIVTFGIADSNEEKEAKMLGFKTIKIYKKWKNDKYDPLQKIYDDTIADYEKMGFTKKDLEEFNNDSAIYDENGKPVTEDETNEKTSEEAEKNKALMDRIDMQNRFRKEYLQRCIEEVKAKDLAWLTTDCNEALFKKMTGEDAGEQMKTKGEKAKALGKTVLKGLAIGATGAALASGAFGLAAVGAGALYLSKKENREKIKSGFKKVTRPVKDTLERFAAAAKGKNLRDAIYKFYKYGEQTKNVMEQGAGAIQSVYEPYETPEKGPSSNGVPGDVASSNKINPDIEAGGGEPTGENFVIKRAEEQKQYNSSTNKPPIQKSTSPFDLQRTNKPKSSSVNPAKINNTKSVAEDFTDTYLEQINEKLDILKRINEEQIRHNDVSEKFFAACLEMMGQIARSNGNTRMASKVDQMVQMVIQ